MRPFRLLPAVRRASLAAAVAAAMLAPAATPALAQPQPLPAADLVVTNARIYTVDPSRPVGQAMAVKDGRVQFVGSERGALAYRGTGTRVVDLDGQTVIPGMTDAHAHFLGLGQLLRDVDLVGTRSYDEVIARVVERARTTPKGQWILGRGWDQNDWGNTAFPTHEALSRAVPDHPVYLARVDGHAGLVNARALEIAGITASAQDPEGGRIERDASGAPTGVFVDNAEALVTQAIPAMTREQTRDALKAASAEMNRWGLTGIHDAGAPYDVITLYQELARNGELTVRTYAMIADDSASIRHFFTTGPVNAQFDGRLWVRSIKLYGDGALGSRGAALLDPYFDDPHNTGLLVSDPAHIQRVAEEALTRGFQVNVHAIGDRGNRVVLDAFEAALAKHPRADHRFRVEHAQILHSDDIPRFAALDVIPSMQAVHQTSDMYWAANRLGSTRVLGAYAWRSLLETGVPVPNGSDFPVELVNPLLSFHSAVSRQDAANWPAAGWFPEQRMTREEALKSMTIWPAYAAFQEDVLGSLTPGKYADFVVLDRDIMRVPAELILGTRVLSTWVGGRAVYEAPR